MTLTNEELKQFLGLPTGNVGDANGRIGNMHHSIKPVDPTCNLVGPAFTVRGYPADNLALHRAIYAANPGDVLIIDCKGYSNAGHFGDIMANACISRGIAGVIIDGSCRDGEDLKAMGFPVFVTALNPGGTSKEHPGELNIPVVCGGVTVRPGDVIVGDGDGVVVVQAENAKEVLERAQAIFAKETKVREMLKEGKTTLEIYGFDKILEAKLAK